MEESVSRSRLELNERRKEYREDSQKYQDKVFGYLNFYAGLLSAILAATLTGLLQVRPGDTRALLLLAGPAATLALALVGYQTIIVFYRRFIEAWVTEVNLEAMLAPGQLVDPGAFGQPRVPSQAGGWLVRWERPEIEEAMRVAADAESLVVEVTRIGDTLRNARLTLLVFGTIAILLSVAATIIATR